MNTSFSSTLFSLENFDWRLLAAQAPYDWSWPMHPMWGWGFGMMLMMALFWGALLLAAIVALRWLLGDSKKPTADSALTILRERFARGEIEKDEFESKKRQLS